MSSPYNTKKFKDLKNLWYKKLKKSGFVEIENTNSEEEYLNRWDSSWFMNRQSNWRKVSAQPMDSGSQKSMFIQAKMEYFYMAGHFLTEYRFDSPRDKEIWKLHSEGMHHVEIAKITKVPKNRVGETVRRLAQEMLKWK